MRVAMITLNVYSNYGNVLQKYALYRTLEKFADFVEVLWQHTTVPFLPYKLELDRWEEGNRRDTAFVSVRQNKIKEFNDANIRTRFDIPYLEEIADEYDFFVIGSDQVWNPDFNVPGKFLDFALPEKRIAYAASITVPELPEEVKETYRQKILEIPHVSVREKDGCDLVEKLTGKRPLHVLDPVFLLTADEWRKLEKRPLWLNSKIYENGYLLTYFFNGNPPQEVRSLAKELGLPMVNLLDLNNFKHYANGIEEFLYLMDNATLLCTQSFHGTAFASIFKKPFIIYKIGKLRSRFSRVASLLELFGLSERVADTNLKFNVEDALKVDFSRREKVLPLERKKAFKFLTEALWQ
ncbi:MAG: polysaccharide pyruvyl transferase family protein [Selenomonadaceae bacterium]|nr:polysaccharide pyruvyl transferase family protein [Selenomonadaceae bacterium]